MKTILSVVGARPNFMKVAPLHKAFQKHARSIRHRIVHTGQHYDAAMSKVFFEDLELPHPDFYLGVGSGSHAEQTAKIMIEFEKVLQQQKPDLVLVVGDVNSTVACSLVSVKIGIPVAHVEAGLRSFDRSMPEEINRLLTDAIADYLFVTEPSGVRNLKQEGVAEDKIFLVGNVMIDSLAHYRQKAKSSNILEQLQLTPRAFTLVTLHRPSNVDDAANLEKILKIFEKLSERTTIVFPIHPRTRKMIEQFGFNGRVSSLNNLKLVDPVGYLDFLNLMEHSQLVLTDSGGIQEETTYLGIPCLTLRENTERPITVEIGTNQLCGLDVERIVHASFDVFEGKTKHGSVPEFWDGKTAERIATILNGTI
ncbi:MAG: UDP-N-acetylglucosamine 2-epimerase (non-hydrolyzing) [Ignavibacteriales bacterium]|nr:UDP-N-acetylglucosamine 2-epimerase (non-hydrolyzing) [Ignavibacteriales bacterium]